ncbi:MAG TPA: hypothetical protein VHF25_06975 [Nitriliruptorales bacterium]|nr:hypothetical protein [Nitriliruptorales bacterium]
MAKRSDLVREGDGGHLVASQRLLVVRAKDGDTVSYVQIAEGHRVPDAYRDAGRVAYSDVFPEES